MGQRSLSAPAFLSAILLDFVHVHGPRELATRLSRPIYHHPRGFFFALRCTVKKKIVIEIIISKFSYKNEILSINVTRQRVR